MVVGGPISRIRTRTYGVLSPLPADLWPNGRLQVVINAIIEIHKVASLDTDADMVGKQLDAASRVNHTVGITVGNRADLVGKSCRYAPVGHTEIQEAALDRHVRLHRTYASLELGAKHSVEQSQT